MGKLTFPFRGLVALALLAPLSIITTLPVAAAHTIAATTTCSNDYLTAVAGEGLICQVTVVNTITGSGGSATVKVKECHGPAAAAANCSTTTTSLSKPVTAVTQCNGSLNGGGTTFLCTVVVTNNFYGESPGSAAATVDQCQGSGGGGGTAMTCDPVPASVSDAAITQCNGSSSGGGGSMTCTATGTMASALAVTINQCNGSANGGGDAVVCSASMTNNALSGTPPPTGTVSNSSSDNSTPLLPLLVLLASGGLGLAVIAARRRRIYS